MNRRFGAISFAILTAIFLPAGILCQVKPYSGGLQTRSLINQSVDESKLVSLSGNTRFEANAANDRGAVPDSFPIEHMLLQLQRPPELEREMVNLIDEMHKPGSPVFHQWMTPDELGQRFGLSGQDIQRITDWLVSHGFQVNAIYPTGLVIDFSGNAAQVRAAFHTEIHNLNVNGEPHISNMRDPQIPAALAGAVRGVVSLHNFMPHSSFKKRPAFDATISGNVYEAVAPGDLATIYNLNPLFAAGLTGVGQTIAVIEDTNIKNASDVATFRSSFGLSGYPGTFSQVLATGSTTCNNPGVNSNESEAALDAEWAGAAAPGAAIMLAYCADTTVMFGGLIALENLVNAGSPPAIMSISYGECEAQNGTANASYVQAYQLAVAQGVSVFVAAGDEGAASCDADLPTASHGIAVSGFASTPYNVAVGGTDFSDDYSGTVNTYWNPMNTPTYESAISYIPEIPWNDSCTSELIFHIEGYIQGYGSTGFCNSTAGHNFLTTSAGSGGPSSYSAQPSWQSVFGLPTASGGPRYLPDVSLFAANGTWGHFYVYCMSDTAEDGSPCNYSNSTDILANAAGGTSFSSPIMAGIMALVNQKAGAPQGLPNPRLYALAAAEYGTTGSTACNSSLGNGVGGSCFFYDVTLGDMDVPCTGTNSCFGYSHSGSTTTYGALSTSTTAFNTAYGAAAGWDFATGIGTVNAYNLVHGWVPASTATTVTSGLNPSTYGASVVLTATITSQNNQAIGGTVAWSANTGCGTTPVTAGTSGVATCTTSVLPGGSDTVTATYSGDITHTGSSGSVTQRVSTIAPTITFTGAPASAPYNSTFTVSSTTNASTTASIVASGACSVSGNTVTMTSGTGTCSLTATWAADNNYNSATATQSTTASKIAPTVTFTGAPASAPYNSTFTVSSTTNASTTASILASGACSISGNTVTMTSNTGTCSLTATWAADNNYTSTTATQSTTASSGVVSGPQPWPNGYSYQATFTVAAGQVPSAQTNFPALISGTFADFATTANGGRISNTCTQTVGNNATTVPCDLIFTSDAAGTVPLSWEFETYTATTGAVNLWVNAPNLSNGTVIYAWYGQASVTTLQTTPSAAWSSNFMAVYHLKENPAGAAPQLNDSTSNGNNGTMSGTVLATQQQPGEIDGSVNFEGDTWASLANPTNFSFERTDSFSISGWFNIPSNSAGTLLSKFPGSSGWALLQFTGSSSPAFSLGLFSSNTSNAVAATPSVTVGAWHYVVATYSGTSTVAGMNIYVDGVDQPLTTYINNLTTSIVNTSIPAINGRAGPNAMSTDSMDELRVSAKGMVFTPAYVTASYNNQNHPGTFFNAVTGLTNSSVASLSPAPSTVSFPNQTVNTTSASQAITLTNNGPGAATISGIAITGTNPGDFAQTNNCPLNPATLAANAFCTINVTFTPLAASPLSAAVSITSNANSPSVGLSGTGTPVPSTVTLAPTSISFPNQTVNTTSSAQAITVTNSGPNPLTITSIAVTGTNPGDFAQTNNCPLSPTTIAVNGFCTINVTFTPQAANLRSAAITITDNGTASPQSVGVSGTGTPVPSTVTLAPTSISFPNQTVNTTSSAQAITVTNSGPNPLTITSIAVTGTNPGDFAQTNNCPLTPTTIAVNGFCTINVTFTPQAANLRSAAITITDNGAASPQSVGVSGTGTAVVTGPQPWPNGYNYQATFTVAAGQVPSTQTNFPALISGTYADFATTANGGRISNTCTQTVGNNATTVPCDLIFTSDAAGAVPLSWEFETYTATTGAANIWVNAPNLANGTVIYAWYGQPSVTTLQTTPSATWSSNFMAVYHLKENPAGTAPQLNDSTSNGNNGTMSGTVLATQQQPGEIDGSINFEGDTWASLANPANFSFERTDSFSISGWFNIPSNSAGTLLSKFPGSNEGWALLQFTGSSSPAFSLGLFSSNTSNAVAATPSVTVGAWHYVVATYSGTSTVAGMNIYVDGVNQPLTTYINNLTTSIVNTSIPAINGRAGPNAMSADSMDELRVSAKGVVFTPAYVTASYNNQSHPGTFFTVVTGLTN
jgi:subtilase family serine protease